MGTTTHNAVGVTEPATAAEGNEGVYSRFHGESHHSQVLPLRSR